MGVEDKSGNRPIYTPAAPRTIDLPNAGSAKAFDLEACMAAEPDLVLLPMKQKDAAAALEKLGVPTLLVLPESHQQILEMIGLIGRAANVSQAAEALTTYYTGKLAEVESLTAGLPDADKPTVYIGGTSGYLTTAPGQMHQSSLIDAAGGLGAGRDIEGASWVEIRYEQLLAMNPNIS